MSFSLSILLAALAASNAAQVAECIRQPSPNATFDISGRINFVSYEGNDLVGFEDNSGTTVLFLRPTTADRCLMPGASVRLRGSIQPHGPTKTPTALCSNWQILGTGSPPAPVNTTLQLLRNGTLDGRIVSLDGTAVDAFRDEIDPDWNYVILDCGGETITVVSPSSSISPERLRNVIDAEIRVEGLCLNHALGARRQLGVTIYLPDKGGLLILRPPPTDPFAVPEVPDDVLSPAQIRKLGKRRVSGHVLAVWSGARALLRTASGQLVGLTFRTTAPPNGSTIEAVGHAETDLYRINLARAEWQPLDRPLPQPPPETVETVMAADILRDTHGNPTVETRYQGRAIRIEGIVISLPRADDRLRLVQMANGDLTIPVDITSAPSQLAKLETGCRIRVDGICILNTENWQPNAGFPHTDGFTIVPRTEDDLVILARPPWWTTQRLLVLIGILVAALIGVATWNRILNRLIERRGRELARERSAHERAELKLEERMRLAVELHDTIAQDLTGITLQAEAAQYAEKPDATRTLAKMADALSGCRERLRDCIWDLRSRSLEEPTFEAAVRRTLTPHLDTTELILDNTVARRHFSDNSLHQILSVLRELTTNAIRHGKATRISISCHMDNERVSLNVLDNGLGFDTAAHPCPPHGHFGLQGVAERIHKLEGSLSIESTVGHGTTIRMRSINPNI